MRFVWLIFVSPSAHCMNLKARRYGSSSLNRFLANKSHHVILSQASFQHGCGNLTIEVSQGYNTPGYSDGCKFEMCLMKACIYTYLQNKRMRRCGVLPPPPPIIFERLKLPQQIIYRRKENLSESPNHQKYWENILVSRFYEQFSRNRRNLGHFRKFEKISNS